MSNKMNLPPPVVPSAPLAAAKAAKKAKRSNSFKHEVRETVEAVVVAFVLAFLFRTFEAEAFVIPTGSMAPTLMGQHKDLICEECAFPYRVSASSESIDGMAFASAQERNAALQARMVTSSVCPNCRHEMTLAKNGKLLYPTYSGDRILVAKFPYSLHEPERWDVVVFRYPDGAKQNYIKRLIGLPNETVQLSQGDVYIRSEGEEQFNIARKPGWKLLAMLQDVYNNDYQPAEWQQQGWPARWQTVDVDTSAEQPQDADWQPSSDLREFAVKAPIASEKWLRYRHFVPAKGDWDIMRERPLTPAEQQRIKPELITDMYGYNTQNERGQGRDGDYLGWHWVGDLAVEFELTVTGESGEVVVELIKGDDAHKCRIDLATGEALLASSAPEPFEPRAKTGIKGPGTYQVMFSNVDGELLLWVDGDQVAFDAATQFVPTSDGHPTAQDLSPIGIGAKGAAISVRHLRVLRDLYYIANDGVVGGTQHITEHKVGGLATLAARERHRNLANPQQWDYAAQEKAFSLEADQFFMLGDNSPKSKDSRLWNEDERFVRRDLLVGKALYVYWPHSLDEIMPKFPNFPQMRFVR